MKVLNGKYYFNKQDILDVINLSVSVVDNPYDNQEYLLDMHDDERDVIKNSIQRLLNSLNWEFISETAIKYQKIQEIANTLRKSKSEIITHTEMQSIPVVEISKKDMTSYENWLINEGIDICINEFKKITK